MGILSRAVELIGRTGDELPRLFQGQRGEILVIVGSYGWHGYYDRIHVWSESEAVAAPNTLWFPRRATG